MRKPAPGVPTAGPVYRFAAEFAFTVFRAQNWQFEVTGLEHVPDRGGAVIAANHNSFWDFFTVGMPSYEQLGRPIRIMAKESLFHVPVFGWLMQRARHIPVHRGEGRVALRSAVEALQSGELVVVLPEQTISRSFDLLPFKTGAARMAGMAGVPLIPAVSFGSHRFHTVGRRPRPTWRLPVSVAYGAPLLPSTVDDPVEVTDHLRRRVQTLLDEVLLAYPRPKGGDDWWWPARLGGGAPEHGEVVAELERLREQWRRRRSA